MIGLDEGLVVSAKSGDWIVAASSSRSGQCREKFSKPVLDKVVAEKQTFFESQVSISESTSLADVQAYVASPIVDTSDRVVGVLFGVRQIRVEDRFVFGHSWIYGFDRTSRCRKDIHDDSQSNESIDRLYP